MAGFLSVDDLTVFAPGIDPGKAESMIVDAEALAVLAAPCLGETGSLSDLQVAAVRAILRGAVLRWDEAGTGAFQQRSQTVGPFGESESYDTRQQRRGMFWPSEITQLQNICGGRASAGAFTVDTVPGGYGLHAEICSVNFGGPCSCGVVLTGGAPLHEGA